MASAWHQMDSRTRTPEQRRGPLGASKVLGIPEIMPNDFVSKLRACRLEGLSKSYSIKMAGASAYRVDQWKDVHPELMAELKLFRSRLGTRS